MPSKYSFRSETVALMAGFVFLAFYNSALWEHLFFGIPWSSGGLAMRVAFGAMALAIFSLVLIAISFRWTLKPALVLLFLVSSAVVHFMQQYGIVIDKNMLRNVAETDIAEVRDLLSGRLLISVLLLGVVPSALVWRLPIRYRPLRRELFAKLRAMLLAATALVLVAIGNYQGLASLLRNHHELRMMTVPSNYLGAGYGYLRESLASRNRPLARIGVDAHRSAAWAAHQRRSLTVLVVGESARAESFGLFGYGRDTTPGLAADAEVIRFGDVSSCGTETAVSLPCMFSNMRRAGYDPGRARRQEGLLDILQRAGLQVAWLDNQSGCKGVCDRVAHENLRGRQDAAYCGSGECHDEILLDGLQAYIDGMRESGVLVLHQMGSHGPEYAKRYPRAFERFTPVCRSNALNDCSREQIVNAYDNSIAYTDHVLVRLIEILRANQERLDVGMIYLSDHGESLGEYQLFLHGTPYVFAPPQQTRVPMLMWFSQGYRQAFGIDAACLRNASGHRYSHDNLFHSMLGLLQIDTREYQPALDLFAPCLKSAPSSGGAGL